MTKFSENIINQRFLAVYDKLEQLQLIKGKSDIAKQLDTYNHVINSILKGNRNVTIDQLNKLFTIFKVNANYVFGLSDEMFLEPPTTQIDVSTIRKLPNDNISMIPAEIMKEYSQRFMDEQFMDSVQKFSIPGMDGTLLAFQIKSDSMFPTINYNDVLICQAVLTTSPLLDNRIYLIVTDDDITAKRIQVIRTNGKIMDLRLVSDNHTVYHPYQIALQDIRQILKVKLRLTKHAIGN